MKHFVCDHRSPEGQHRIVEVLANHVSSPAHCVCVCRHTKQRLILGRRTLTNPRVEESILTKEEVETYLGYGVVTHSPNPDIVADIVAFHEKYGLAYNGPPRALDEELMNFRMKLIDEEYTELKDAECDADQLDACVDLVYVILGYCYLRGWNFAEAWRRVQSANMSKVRAKVPGDSKRGTTFDVVKPPGWVAPHHDDLVKIPTDEAKTPNH